MAKEYKLPADMVAKLRQEQRNLHDILLEFDKADECGLDCQEFRSIHKDYSDRIEAMLRNYGPAVS